MIDPASSLNARSSLLLDGDRVEALVSDETCVSEDVPRLNADGLIVTPGFVDIHAHLRFPGQEAKETIASGTTAAVRGGFTTVCAMANTQPAIDSPALVESVLTTANDEARCHVQTFGAVSQGLAGRKNTDAGDLLNAGALALSDDGRPVGSPEIMTAALIQSARQAVVISVHEESHPANDATKPWRWGCHGEADMVRRDIDLVRSTGGKLHVAHVSCVESLELISSAKAAGLPVTAEATPHHLALTDEFWDGDEDLPPEHGLLKVNPPLRAREHSVALGAALQSRVIDAVATDHAPHASSEKCLHPADAAYGFTGFEMALPLLLRLVASGVMGLSDVVERLTIGPARCLGLQAGTLAPGAPADVCIFDPAEPWLPSRDSLVGKGKNHPLLGRQLIGRVKATIVAGRVFQFERDHGLRAFRAF